MADTRESSDEQGTRDELLAQLRERARNRFPDGAEADRLVQPPAQSDPIAVEGLIALLQSLPRPLDLEVSASTRPVIGRGLTLMRRAAVRAVREPLIRDNQQRVAFDAAIVAALSDLSQQVADLTAETAQLRAQLDERGR